MARKPKTELQVEAEVTGGTVVRATKAIKMYGNTIKAGTKFIPPAEVYDRLREADAIEELEGDDVEDVLDLSGVETSVVEGGEPVDDGLDDNA